jgi:hypothetical protein
LSAYLGGQQGVNGGDIRQRGRWILISIPKTDDFKVFVADAVARVSSGSCCASYAGAREVIGDDVSAPAEVADLIANGRAVAQ